MRSLEYCSLCDQPTGNAGAADGSNFCPITEKGPYCDGCFKSRIEGMSEVLAEVVERQKKCELEYGGVMPPRDDPRHEGWCVYCWACAELEKLKGEP